MLRKIMAVFLVMTLLCINLGMVFANDEATIQNFSGKFKYISEQEYLESVASSKGYTIDQAKKYVNHTIEEHRKSLNKNYGDIIVPSAIGDIEPVPGQPGYHYARIYDLYEEYPGVVIEIGVPGIIYSSGSFTGFVSINEDSAYTSLISPGVHNWQESYAEAYMNSGSSVTLRGRGVVYVDSDYALNMGINLNGWSFAYIHEDLHVYRKAVSISHTENL